MYVGIEDAQEHIMTCSQWVVRDEWGNYLANTSPATWTTDLTRRRYYTSGERARAAVRRTKTNKITEIVEVTVLESHIYSRDEMKS